MTDSAERKPAKKGTKTSTKASKIFTDEERLAIRDRAKEVKAAARRGPRANEADGESAVLAKIAEFTKAQRRQSKT